MGPICRNAIVAVAWLLSGMAPAAAQVPAGVLVPGTVLDGMSKTIIDSTHTLFCLINPSVAGPSGSQSFVTLGPAATAFQQDRPGGPVILTIPGVAQGELIVNGSQTEAAFTYYSQGTAILTFTSASTGSIAFLGGGTTLPNKAISLGFNGFSTSFDTGTNRLFVSFGITLGGCAVAFRGAFQA